MFRFQYTEFYIFFKEGLGWKRRLLKKGFGHVFIVTKDEFNWIEINPGTVTLGMVVLPFLNTDNAMDSYIRIFDHLKYRYRILKVTLKKERPQKNAYWIPTCVNIVLYCMGLKLWALTPFGLYRKLLNMSLKKRSKLYIEDIEIIK